MLNATPARAQPGESGGENPPGKRPKTLTIMLGTQAALHSVDMVTTGYNLRHGGHVREANPLLAPFAGQPAALAAVSGGINILQIYTIAKLHPSHPKMAKAWALILIGTEAFAVTNNLRVAGQLKR